MPFALSALPLSLYCLVATACIRFIKSLVTFLLLLSSGVVVSHSILHRCFGCDVVLPGFGDDDGDKDDCEMDEDVDEADGDNGCENV